MRSGMPGIGNATALIRRAVLWLNEDNGGGITP